MTFQKSTNAQIGIADVGGSTLEQSEVSHICHEFQSAHFINSWSRSCQSQLVWNSRTDTENC